MLTPIWAMFYRGDTVATYYAVKFIHCVNEVIVQISGKLMVLYGSHELVALSLLLLTIFKRAINSIWVIICTSIRY